MKTELLNIKNYPITSIEYDNGIDENLFEKIMDLGNPVYEYIEENYIQKIIISFGKECSLEIVGHARWRTNQRD